VGGSKPLGYITTGDTGKGDYIHGFKFGINGTENDAESGGGPGRRVRVFDPAGDQQGRPMSR